MKRRGWLAAALIATSIARGALAAPPTPTELEEARRHYARGRELYNQGADAAALAELERAYQLAPNWKVLYDMGLVELQLHDFAAALRHFERYLAEGGDGISAARRAEIDAQVARLRDQVAVLDVTADGGAEIALDDVSIGTAPLGSPIRVNPGHHKLVATKDGRRSEPRVLSVAGGDHLSIALTVPPPPPAPSIAIPAGPIVIPPPPAPPPAPREEPAVPRPSWLWATGIGAGVLAGGAVITGLVALNASSELSHAKTDGPASGRDLQSMASRAHGFAVASDVLTGAALVSAGVTVYFALRPPSPAAGGASVTVGLAPSGVTLRGAF